MFILESECDGHNRIIEVAGVKIHALDNEVI